MWARIPGANFHFLKNFTEPYCRWLHWMFCKCSCRWLHGMFWLLIAMNALASIYLEHSCRPMPCTLLHIIALNTFDWLFVVLVLQMIPLKKYCKWLHWKMLLQMIALNVLATDCIKCSGKYLPWTLLQTNALYTLAYHCIEHIWKDWL
jgi:hypothetical protein